MISDCDSVRPNRYRLIDLFAGCGGMTRGFTDSGRFESIFAVEVDPYAAATYAANFGPHVLADAIQAAAWFPEAEVMIGGPPCQGFSALNRSGVGLERRALQAKLNALFQVCIDTPIPGIRILSTRYDRAELERTRCGSSASRA